MKSLKSLRQFPENVFSALFPLYLISTLFGLLPLSTKKLREKRNIFYSQFSVARTIIQVIGYSLLLFYIVYTIQPVNIILCKIRFYQDIISALLFCCEIILGCIFAKNIANIYDGVNKIDHELRNLKIYGSYKETYLRVIAYLTIVPLVFFIILLLLVTTETFLSCYSSQLHNVLMLVFAYYMPFIANLLVELQYVQYLDLVQHRFKELNSCLLKNIESTKSTFGFEHMFTITKVRPKPINQNEANESIYTVNQVAKIHMMLTETARLVGKVFCFQQLLKIAISFISIVGGLFLFAMIFAVKDPSRLHVDVLFFIWTAFNAMEMFVLVRVSAKTRKEANNCPILLHRIRNCTTNEKLKSLIDLHSLQMYHNRLAFSVCGLFPLDYSLLYSMIAGATTYLVIVIQFNVDMVKAYNNGTIY